MNLELKASQFKALGHPARLRIVNLLKQHDSLCVCEIMRVLEFGQSFVSRHLAILREAELVSAEKNGTWAHYRLQPSAAKLLESAQLEQVPCLQSDLALLNKTDCQAC